LFRFLSSLRLLLIFLFLGCVLLFQLFDWLLSNWHFSFMWYYLWLLSFDWLLGWLRWLLFSSFWFLIFDLFLNRCNLFSWCSWFSWCSRLNWCNWSNWGSWWNWLFIYDFLLDFNWFLNWWNRLLLHNFFISFYWLLNWLNNLLLFYLLFLRFDWLLFCQGSSLFLCFLHLNLLLF